jgi:Ca2+-binding EF-hand superfamily protein
MNGGTEGAGNDVLGDGTIDFDEMKLLLRCFLEESPSLDMEETLAELTATLFQETDIDQSGDISFEELADALKRNEHLFKVLSLR